MFPKDIEEAVVPKQLWVGLIRGLAIVAPFWIALLVYLCLTNPWLSHTFWR